VEVFVFRWGEFTRARPSGRTPVQLLVAYGARADGSRQLLAFVRSQGKSQAAWERLLEDLYRRGLQGQKLKLIVTDGCAGLLAAVQIVYPRVPHQRCWVHQMCNLVQARGPHGRRSSHLQR
jgi:putative transposase